MPLLPNKEEIAEFRRSGTEAGVNLDKGLPFIIEAHKKGEVDIDSADAYWLLLKAEHPELWPETAEAAAKREADEKTQGLIDAIVVDHRNPNARGALVRAVGKANADKLVREIGLNGIGDFVSKPRKPDETKAPDSGKPDDSKTNPWSRAGWNVTRQGQLVRAAGLTNAQKMAAAAGSFIGATRPPSQ